MVSAQILSPYYNGVTSFEKLPKFYRDNVFSYKPLRGSYILITIHSLFHFFKNSQHPEKWSFSFKNFLKKYECISCYPPVSSNWLKMFFIKTSLFELTVTSVIKKKCSVSCIFQTSVVIVVIKILEKYMWRTAFLKNSSTSWVSSLQNLCE